MILVGIVLLLPGLCAVLMIGNGPRQVLSDPATLVACLAFLLISGCGIALIWAAVRRPR